PLRARAVAIVLTGATEHHFLAVDSLRNVLGGFFGAYALPGGLYVPHGGFDAGGELVGEWREQAERLGQALVALAAAIESSSALSGLGPQI
ncbi:MAG: NAD(P)H-dependent oxidoreductase, partial [Solirubrobacteraceae bacterium]